MLTSGGSVPAAELGLSDPARSALRKLAAGLPASVRPRAEDQSRYVLVNSCGWHRSASMAEPDRRSARPLAERDRWPRVNVGRA